MYQSLLADTRFFELLLHFDEEQAGRARLVGCDCGGALHSAHYTRKPRGGPEGLGPEHDVRFSFCCAVQGCRRRTTPASLRFLGRKVYYGAVVALMPVLLAGPTTRLLQGLCRQVGVSARTLRRWCRWWSECVAGSRFFAAARGSFATGLVGQDLPGSVLAAVSTLPDPTERLVAVLRWLAPLSTGSGGELIRAR